MSLSTALVWFRRDLRPDDHAALYHALTTHERVYLVFVFDTDILANCKTDDRRVSFIWESLGVLNQYFSQYGSQLYLLHGKPQTLIPELAQQLACQAVYCNHDYEAAAQQRDQEVAALLQKKAIDFHSYKDQVIFERDEIQTATGDTYSVFTPYSKRWLNSLEQRHLSHYNCTAHYAKLYYSELKQGSLAKQRVESLEQIGFTPQDLSVTPFTPGFRAANERLQHFEQSLIHYKAQRDYPAKQEQFCSLLSAHLRFGTLSIRQAVRSTWPSDSIGAETWLSELIWREFYHQFLYRYPHTEHTAFKSEFANIHFPNNAEWFARWQQGLTGYPLIDAGMRQLQQTGYMHNRVRMICASFLCKDLLIDWRWGERHFAQLLMDYDMASNVGGWQWAASTGCDAQPYFRIFNPVLQSQKFDADGSYIRRYVPELAQLDKKSIHAPWLSKQLPLGFHLGESYPAPIVDHATQRERALTLYKDA